MRTAVHYCRLLNQLTWLIVMLVLVDPFLRCNHHCCIIDPAAIAHHCCIVDAAAIAVRRCRGHCCFVDCSCIEAAADNVT